MLPPPVERAYIADRRTLCGFEGGGWFQRLHREGRKGRAAPS